MHLFFLSISVYLRPATENAANRAYADAQSDNGELLGGAGAAGDNDGGGGGGDGGGDADDSTGIDITNIFRYCSEVCTLTGVLSYVIFQQGDEIKNQGLAAFTKQLVHAPAKAIFLLSNILILACIPFRLIGDTDTEEAILVFAVPGSWFLLMFFAG